MSKAPIAKTRDQAPAALSGVFKLTNRRGGLVPRWRDIILDAIYSEGSRPEDEPSPVGEDSRDPGGYGP